MPKQIEDVQFYNVFVDHVFFYNMDRKHQKLVKMDFPYFVTAVVPIQLKILSSDI